MSQLCIALTGGLASGKSTVGKLFAQHNIEVFDADVIVKQLLSEPEIIDLFSLSLGAEILNDDGTLNKVKFKELIFSDSNTREFVEAILHPAVRIHLREAAAEAQSPYVLLQIPLLYSLDNYPEVNRVLTVEAPLAMRQQRALDRDGTSADTFKHIIAQQPSDAVRQELADDVIKNDQDEKALKQAVDRLHAQYLEEAANHLD